MIYTGNSEKTAAIKTEQAGAGIKNKSLLTDKKQARSTFVVETLNARENNKKFFDRAEAQKGLNHI